METVSLGNEPNTLQISTSGSPHGSPKHSPRSKKETARNEASTRDSSPFLLEKPDADQQVSTIA